MHRKSQIVLDGRDIATLRWVLDYVIELYCEIIESKNAMIHVGDFERDLKELERLRSKVA